MSLITRCPACQTLFKVVPDQLRISDGWVRCGQCDEVFDASLHLLQSQPELLPQPQPPTPTPTPTPTPAVPLEAVELPSVIESESNQLDDADESPDEPEQPEPVWPDAAQVSASEELEAASLPSQPPLPEPTIAAPPDPVAVVEPNNKDVEPHRPDSDSLVPEHPAELSDVSFLRNKRGRTFWDKSFMRVALGLLSLILVLALAGQMAFHERDRIAAMQPELKPWLLAMCKSLNCSLSPLRRIESIVVDSSSFTRIQEDSYRLNLTLINTATMALALPAFELTLTDSRDQPVVRRVLLPGELGAKSDSLAAGTEWPATLAFTVKTGDGLGRVAGYRLLAFYP